MVRSHPETFLYRFTRDETFLKAAQKTADGLLTAIRSDGWLPGRLSSKLAWGREVVVPHREFADCGLLAHLIPGHR
jgi:hypothetical protein